MIKSVNNYPVSQLFDIEAGVVYAIPRYQREYTWGKNQWENLFDDVLENDPSYFLGSIICINQSTDVLSIQKLELVDGQQRLTTLSLLFAAVYHALKSHETDLDDEQRVELINLKRKLVLKKGDDQIRLIPQIQNNNNQDYRAVLADIGVISECDVPAYAGNRKIFRAYRYFQDRIDEMANGRSNRLGTIMEFLDKVSHACLVKIEVASHADAYTLFESLNNRGMPLTAIDLIKNKLLARLESIEPGKVDHYFGHWSRLLGYLGDDYAIQERFFRQYYNAFKDQLKAIHQVPVATRSNLIHIYEKFINHDAKDCLQKISAAGRLYSLILSRNQDDAPNSLEKPLKDLERIQGAPSYLLMLYLLVRKDELELANAHLKSIVELLVRFFVRRNLTDTPPTRDLTRLFMTVIDKISGLRADAIPQSIEQQLVAVSATDEIFQRKLEGPIYEENSGVTRFILCALAEQSMTKESWVDLWRFENKQFVWTIEHIFPQGENIPQSWITMIADGDEVKAKEIQQTHVHKLGNLTISGFNSALGNKSFEDKRDRVDRLGRAVGYKNGLKLNKDLAAATGWSVGQITARTKKFVQQTTQLFKLQGGEA
ncbi:MAG: DUF262 domain-containing protein [Desulfovibrio sp.]|nr:DUF262 domain-containing protein [Desulfovibrio sp.]